jgi:hypothetical protein
VFCPARLFRSARRCHQDVSLKLSVSACVVRLTIASIVAVRILGVSNTVSAQTSNTTYSPGPTSVVVPAYSDFFQIRDPGQFSITGFGGGFRADRYATTQQGFQFEQSVTNYIGVVGRITGYQLYIGQGFADPLAPTPDKSSSARLNFVRLQGGIDFSPYPLTRIYVFGGKDLGDSDAATVEGNVSSWVNSYSKHPVNLAASSNYNYQNKVINNEIDLRVVAWSGEQYMLLAGGGGAIYNGGFIKGLQGQGGVDLGGYLQRLQTGIDLQGGYGNAGWYGEVNLYVTFSFQDSLKSLIRH